MITQFFIERFADLLSFVLSVFPSYELPAFLQQAMQFWTSTIASITQFGNFIPLNTISICVTAIFAAYSFSYIVKITRIIISYLTAGGGNIQ